MKGRVASLHTNRKLARLLAVSILGFFCRSLSQTSNADFQRFWIDDPKYRSIVLARVGDREITAQEFLLNYEYGPAFPKREQDSKKRYLNFMIYEKLLALEGYAARAQKVDDVRQTLTEVEADLATEELYKEDVLKKVKVTVQEVERGVGRERVHLSLKWIYSASRGAIEWQRDLIDHGTPFDSLFDRQLSDSLKADDRSFETTKFKLESRNPLFSNLIDSLPVQTISKPVKGPDGWYLVKIVDAWMNPIVTESENMKLREDVRRAVVQHKADSLSDAYVNAQMMKENPVIQRPVFEILHAELARVVLPTNTYMGWNFSGRIQKVVPGYDSTKFDSYRDRALVQTKSGTFSMNDFMKWYKSRETAVRLTRTSPVAFFASVEQLVWRMVRDRLLTLSAFRRGFQNRESVVRQKRWWEEKLVYEAEKRLIAQSIAESDSALRSYFAENRRQYKSASGEELTFEKARDDVRRDYVSAEFTKRMLHKVLFLKEKFGVTVHEDALKALYVDIENQPRAIDVYTVKTGGILPRPAFPSIDYEWQSWN